MFNILAINNWILAFIAFGYYFFIIPKASDSFFYFQYIGLVSNYLGFFIFASIIFVFAIFAVFSAKMERLYSFYEIPRIMKIAMMFAWPFLMISIISSTYLATLTPWGLSPMYYKTTLELVSFSSLLISIALLITPFFSENIEAIRSRFFDQIWRGR
jgi:hypothetical protein